ncbi:MAG: biotin transporter BioY, partial [Lachnospiraceae bacterium]|nr:biotin transporter BioY [Lachnospiraceae bacterium]
MKHTKNLVFMSLFAALIAVGAFIRVPMPLIPFTLQTFFVMMAGNLLGAKYAAGSALVYVLIGLCGVPVFTGGGGFTYIFQPTFGYLIGFIFAAFFIGMIVHKKRQSSWKRLLAGDLVGLIIW